MKSHLSFIKIILRGQSTLHNLRMAWLLAQRWTCAVYG